MFLKLLTAQMQNQDPLDPMDTSKYTEQLVQFSQVEQTIQQSSTLKDILASLTTQNMSQTAGFIGKTAEFDTDVAGLPTDGKAQWSFNAARDVEKMVATISDANGKVVDTREISASKSGEFDWDGALANGKKAAEGPYTLAIKGTDASGAEVSVAVGSRGVVRDVVTADGALSLGVNGIRLPAANLVRVADAG